MPTDAPRIWDETVISLSEAARKIPSFRGGRPTAASTLWRWARDGIRRPDGTILKLEAIRIVSRWVTSSEALARFLAAQQVQPAAEGDGKGDDADGTQAPQALRIVGSAAWHKQADAAEAELVKRGA